MLLWILSLFPHITIYREGGEKYLTRYCLLGGSPYDTNHPFLPFNLFIHCFHASDHKVPHNHPWMWAKSLILRGGYIEHRHLPKWWQYNGIDRYNIINSIFLAGQINRLDDMMYHWVELLTPTVWTLFMCGRKTQPWGFWVEGEGFVPAAEYIRRMPGATTNERIIDA